MTLNKFSNDAFAQTQDSKSFGAAVTARVEHGRDALSISANKRQAAPHSAANAA
jgi:hypothetical protein